MAFWQSAGPDPVADLCRPGRRGLRLGDDAAPAAAGAADALPFLGAASGDVQPAGERGRSRAGLGRHAPSHALALAAHDGHVVQQRVDAHDPVAACAAEPSGKAGAAVLAQPAIQTNGAGLAAADRKSTRLNSSHLVISYAVFC